MYWEGLESAPLQGADRSALEWAAAGQLYGHEITRSTLQQGAGRERYQQTHDQNLAMQMPEGSPPEGRRSVVLRLSSVAAAMKESIPNCLRRKLR